MLYKIEIENFYSVGERQVVDLRARKSVDDPLGRLSPIHRGAEERAPNVVTVFGPNAAGKSNILRAIAFGAWFGGKSSDLPPDHDLPYDKFGSEDRILKPTRLSFSFAGPADLANLSREGPQCPYTYEIVLSGRDDENLDAVRKERMSYRPKGRGKSTTIFERDDLGSVKAMKGFLPSGTDKALKATLRPRASVIATLAQLQLNHVAAQAFVQSLSSVVSNIFLERVEEDEGQLTRYFQINTAAREELRRIARRIDLGIEEIGIGKATSDPPRLLFKHSGLDQIITFDRESHGTRQFIKVFPYILMALDNGGVAVIDELDTTIHPLILPEILRWFSDRDRNPHNAQLWATCHSASLLSELTKEEVLFCEKDATGNTSVFKLADIERVRRNENFHGKYLGGEYGAVPVLG